MKHLRKFEEINYVNEDEDLVNPHINDYVICEEKFGNQDKCDFINNNIGQIIECPHKNNNVYLIKFENVPYKASLFFQEKQPDCRGMIETKYLIGQKINKN